MQFNYENINKESVESLVTNNMQLVKKIAWHLHGRVRSIIDIEDLIQIGMVGLVAAAQNYKPQKGASFSSYAHVRISGEIIDFLRKNSNLCRTTIKWKQTSEKSASKLRRKLSREPRDEEIATDLGLKDNEFQHWKEAFAASTLEDLESVYNEFSIWFATGTNTPEEDRNDEELKDMLLNSLKLLSKREALVIQLYFVEELNIYEIAKVLEISTGRVSQIKSSAIALLRKNIQKLQDFPTNDSHQDTNN